MLMPHCFDHCSFVISFEITTRESYNFVFQDFEYWGPLRFHMGFRMKLSIPARSLIEILMEIVLNLQIVLDSIAILTTMNILIHECGISSHLLCLP